MNDDGFTSLPGGRRLSKSDPLLDALGSLDELNAALGLLRAALDSPPDAALIESLQKQVLAIGGELATGQSPLPAAAPAALEAETARREAALPPLHGFVLPGATETSARAHFARAVCRRAERDFLRARDRHPDRPAPAALPYLNRLSALLFALARSL